MFFFSLSDDPCRTRGLGYLLEKNCQDIDTTHQIDVLPPWLFLAVQQVAGYMCLDSHRAGTLFMAVSVHYQRRA